MMSLRQIRKADPFAATRPFDEIAAYHVWHARLGIEHPADQAAVDALARERGMAIVGPPGSGKTSALVAAALGTDGMAVAHVPLRLSINGAAAAQHAHDARFLAGQMVRVIARLSQQVDDLVDEATTSGTGHSAATVWTATLGSRAARLAREIRQRTESVNFERNADEVLGVAAEAVRRLREDGLRPVLLLEDADGLLRVPGMSDPERHAVANGFFADGLTPLMREVGVPVLLAVQPDYRDLSGFESIVPFLDDVVDAPSPARLSENGVRLLLAEIMRTAGIDRELGGLFSQEALTVVLATRYSLKTIRHLLQICDRSLKHAISGDQSVIEEPDVAYAISQ